MRYFVTFQDDFTKFSMVYFLARKSEVFQKFREFSAVATKLHGSDILKLRFQHSNAVQSLRVDGGGEYASNQFKLYCKQTGVTLSVTTPYTPVHNAKAERLGGALQHSAKSMLSESGMPIVYWPEAVQSANFARNRVLIGKSGKSPAEL